MNELLISSIVTKVLSNQLVEFRLTMKVFLLIVFVFLISSVSGLSFTCSYSLRIWAPDKMIYTCVVQSIENGNVNVIEELTGDHQAESSNADVLGIIIQEKVLHQIPQNLVEFFPNLIGFICINSSLQLVSAEDLQPFSDLYFFRVWGNQIKSLDRDLFQFNRKLMFIDFDLNRLEQVGTNLIGNLHQLREADFRNNPCIDVFANDRLYIENLNKILPIRCPPLNEPPTTTELPQCKVRCSLEDEVDQLKEEVEKLNNWNTKQDERINELENLIHGLM